MTRIYTTQALLTASAFTIGALAVPPVTVDVIVYPNANCTGSAGTRQTITNNTCSAVPAYRSYKVGHLTNAPSPSTRAYLLGATLSICNGTVVAIPLPWNSTGDFSPCNNNRNYSDSASTVPPVGQSFKLFAENPKVRLAFLSI